MHTQPESLFLPATPRKWVVALCKWALSPMMRTYYRIKAVQVAEFGRGTRHRRLVFVANHVDRRDAVVAFAISKQLHDEFYFMSNREQLQEGTFYTWLLRSCGVFSIARGLVDIASIKYTTRLLTDEKPNRLFLFPEGGAFSRNDAVFPFLTQPFELILRANKQLKDDGIAVVPVAIRYEYGNVNADIDKAVSQLEKAVAISQKEATDFAGRLLAVGSAVVDSFDRIFDTEVPGYETEVHERGLRIKKYLIDSLHAQMALIGGEEPRHIASDEGELEQARQVLNQLYGRHTAVRADADLSPKNEYEARLRTQIFERMSRVFDEARRLENWVGLDRDYFTDNVTTGRIVDAIIRLEREVFGEVLWSAERTAVVKLGEPIEVANYSDAAQLAADCRDKVVEMLRS